MQMLPPPPPGKPVQILDTECFPNYWLIKFYNRYTKTFLSFEMYDGHPLDRASVVTLLNACTTVGFNSKNYDTPMIFCALSGMTCAQLKVVNDFIIMQNMKPWDVEREFNVSMPRSLDHIDLIEVAPTQSSLKMYGGKMHSKKIQDLPYEPSRHLTRAEMIEVEKYCGNDLIVTNDLYNKFAKEIATREELSLQYGEDMRSRSDAQIAEAAFKKLLPFKVNRPEMQGGKIHHYVAPAFLQYTTPQMRGVLQSVTECPFTLQWNGLLEMHDKALADQTITIGKGQYNITVGGLHSKESKASHRAGNGYTLIDVDVASYYPKIISILRLYPEQIGQIFLTIYDEWIEVRITYKNSGNKKKADTFKIKLNGTFGKTNSPYSILFSPQMFLQIVITGQLSLLMMIEALHQLPMCEVVSANTDGIVIKCHESQHAARDAVIADWERRTGFTTERVDYAAIFSRDVNAYFAFKTDGAVKLKGAYAPPEPVASSWPSPHAEISIDAVIEYIKHGTPVEQTIRRCADIRKFVSVKKVAGGGKWTATGEYLGKTVRWYYARDHRQHYIEYANNGNKVGESMGAKPCMELPDILPPDIDYEWYAKKAVSIMMEIGVR